MDVIGVIDLRHGQAVHARGGVRGAYAPVRLPGAEPGDAVALARHYAGLGVRTLYVADLDAIEGRAPHRSELDALVATGMPVWLDAAVSAPARVEAVRAGGVAQVVIGLESLPSVDRLPSLVASAAVAGAAGAGATEASLVLSLDLRGGVPLTEPDEDPVVIARLAADAGIGTILLLDLARVGAGSGFDTTLLTRLRAALPASVRLAVGGGLGHRRDLEAAVDAGCAAVLVASALLDGRLTAADVHAVRSRR